jgi:hypothetical protein
LYLDEKTEKTMRYDFEIKRKSDDELLCSGYLKIIGLDPGTWKTTTLPGDVMAKLLALSDRSHADGRMSEDTKRACHFVCSAFKGSEEEPLLYRSSLSFRPVLFSHSEMDIPYSFWLLSLYHSGITLKVQNGMMPPPGVA